MIYIACVFQFEIKFIYRLPCPKATRKQLSSTLSSRLFRKESSSSKLPFPKPPILTKNSERAILRASLTSLRGRVQPGNHLYLRTKLKNLAFPMLLKKNQLDLHLKTRKLLKKRATRDNYWRKRVTKNRLPLRLRQVSRR